MKYIKNLIVKENDENLWETYSLIIKELKKRELIRTKNITGERGEQIAINYYNKTKGLPVLQATPSGTKNIDAISRKGERYAIKTIMKPNKTTGVFYGLGSPNSPIFDVIKFEYLIIVIIDDAFKSEKILEITWKDFLKFIKWHSRMQAFNISINNKLLKKAKIIFGHNTSTN